VVGPPATAEAAGPAGWSSTELANAWPDISLLPDTAAAFAASVDHTRPFGQFPTVTAALAGSLASSWAFPAEAFTVLVSGKAALSLALDVALEGANRVVAVETPGLVRSAAVLRALDARVVPLAGDAEGPTVESVREALALGASVITLQPVCRIPVGSTLSTGRRDALASLISAHPRRVVVIEEDPVGLLYSGTSLGAVLPDRTVRLTQYWRALGPDIDMVAVGGSAEVVERVRAAQRTAGLRVGGLLQEVVTRLLGDPRARALATAAGHRYAYRHAAFVAALEARGVSPASFGGLFAWIPVHDAEATLASLAAGGVRLLGGDSSFAVPPGRDFVRLATTRLPDDPFQVADLAAAVASAAQGGTLVDTE
jgi:DNA-binding transcriptional MocR family regulator